MTLRGGVLELSELQVGECDSWQISGGEELVLFQGGKSGWIVPAAMMRWVWLIGSEEQI